jgi:hypothetical protein
MPRFGFETHDPGVYAGEDNPWLRPRGQYYRLTSLELV